MAYKILYIDDLETKSREKDIEDLGYEVKLYNPTSNLSDLFSEIEDFKNINAFVLDYRLTKGKNNACFDAPTIAQTLRTKHKENLQGSPMVLMSNETIKVSEFDKDFTSQDLFDFVLTKEGFSKEMPNFKKKLDSFINAYEIIKKEKFNLKDILDITDDNLLQSRINSHVNKIDKNVFMLSNFIYYEIIRPIGIMIGEDVLSARLGVDKHSEDWERLKEQLKPCMYSGIFSDYHNRWWMNKVNEWWSQNISSKESLRRLNAEERTELLKSKLNLKNLTPHTKTKYSKSTNFWTICKYSKTPLDPFDGVELCKDNLPWQDKEYISIVTALEKMEDYKHLVSKIDKKAIREIVKEERTDG